MKGMHLSSDRVTRDRSGPEFVRKTLQRCGTASPNPAIRMLLSALSLVQADIRAGLGRETGRRPYDVTLAGLLSMMINYRTASQYRKWPAGRSKTAA